MLPSWMKMRHDPENSEGAKLMNAPGVQLYDIEKLIESLLIINHPSINATNMGGIDVGAIDVIYKAFIQNDTFTPDTIVRGVRGMAMDTITQVTTIYNFYKADGLKKYYYDSSSGVMYFTDKYDVITVNDATYNDVVEHNVWTPYDEIGLLLGCPRIPGERNVPYKVRLLDVFQRPGSSTRPGLINFLSRSFSINEGEVIVQELTDNFVKSLINPDGSIKAELKEYMKLSNKVNLSSSDIYWEILDENRDGMNYLPMVWDIGLTQWSISNIQNGIGHAPDLEIIGPEQENTMQDFNYSVGIEGIKTNKTKVYPQHEFEYRVVAKGYRYDDGYSPEDFKYAVVASDLIPLKFNVRAHKDYTHDFLMDPTGGTVVDESVVTDEDKQVANFVKKNVAIQPGSVVMSPNNRYIEIMARLRTTDRTKTPTVNTITLNYKNATATPKQIAIDTQSAITQNGDLITAGFASNTWTDITPILKIRNDTNDNYNVLLPEDGTIVLSHGEYEKIYQSEGDWDDRDETGTINIRVSTKGTLKLSI